MDKQMQNKLNGAISRISDIKSVLDLEVDHIDWMMSKKDVHENFLISLLNRSLDKLYGVNQALCDQLDVVYLELEEVKQALEQKKDPSPGHGKGTNKRV